MHCHVWSTLKFCFSVSFNFVVSFSIKILSFRCFPYSDRLRAPHMYGGNWWCLAFPSFMPLVLMSSFFYHYYYCSSFLISWAPSATGAPIPGMHERSLFLILNHLRTVTTRVISLSLSLCAMPRRPHNIYKRTYTIVVYQKTKNKKNVGENS